MAGLNKKQKELLDYWYFVHKKDVENGKVFFNIDKCDCFTYELFEKLQDINDFETLSQAINSYIQNK